MREVDRMGKHIRALMREAERCYARGDLQGGYVQEGFAQRRRRRWRTNKLAAPPAPPAA